MTAIAQLHKGTILGRRARVLTRHLAEVLPQNVQVLDVGCGDGLIDYLITQQRPDITVVGLDTIVRPETHMPVSQFDGERIPFEGDSFDVVMCIDVLHHTDDPAALLREARRVARQSVILKDHTREGFLAGFTLRAMDCFGNSQHGIPLPFNYWTERRWRETFAQIGLSPVLWRSRLNLYPTPASWLFDRSLHFITRLDLVSSTN